VLARSDEVVRRIEAKLAAETSAEHRLIGPAPCELDAPRPDRLGGSTLREAQDEREEQIGHQRRRIILREEPLEAQSCFTVLELDPDLLGADETLVAGELLESLAESGRVQSRQYRDLLVVRERLDAETQPDVGVRAALLQVHIGSRQRFPGRRPGARNI
jgi:hypothetical protein